MAVASADHVRIGRSNGFVQVCHGKSAPLMRIHPGAVYYSPTGAGSVSAVQIGEAHPPRLTFVSGGWLTGPRPTDLAALPPCSRDLVD